MKKFFKFVVSVAAIAGIAVAGLTLYKKFIAKDCADDFDDFEDDLDDLDFDDDADKDSREYVSLDVATEDKTDETEEAVTEKAE